MEPSQRRTPSECGVVHHAAGRGIVLSSGARSAFELRGPADVANLATLFGLNQRQAKANFEHLLEYLLCWQALYTLCSTYVQGLVRCSGLGALLSGDAGWLAACPLFLAPVGPALERRCAAQVALTDVPAAVIEHGVARRAYKGALTIERLQPAEGATAAGSDSAGGASAAATNSAAPDGAATAAEGAGAATPGAAPADGGGGAEAAGTLGALPVAWAATPQPKGRGAKRPPPQPLRQKPQQQRQRKGKRKR